MKRNILFILSSIIVLLVSCSDETQDAGMPYPGGPSPLTIYASISGKASTRATISDKEDKWTYTDFTSDDAMGFYSSAGNWQKDEGKGAFINQELIYKDGRFTTSDGYEFSPTHLSGSQIFMYFPYDEGMSGEGMKLRVEVEDNDTLRCRDLLSSNTISLQGVENGQKVALYGDFDHAFSELIILRGEGFDNPPLGKERITAVLDNPYTHIKVNVSGDDDSGTTWSSTPQLVFVPNSQGSQDDIEKERDNARKWDAWYGGNFDITQQDQIGSPAWYIIVPTIGSEVGKKKSGSRSRVEYIELYDNEGYLQRVSSLKLSGGNSKYVDAGWRYPMTISMKELVPTVNPFPILPWKEDIDLTDERQRGINNETDFGRWVADYNAYLADPDDEAKINALYQYGDLYKSADGTEKTWHFYVLSDLNLKNYTADAEGNNGVIISQLKDILDGISTTFVKGKFINHTITGLSKTFIGTMSGKGLLQNFDFIEPEIHDGVSTSPAGIIVNEMDGTSVINCNIDDGDMFYPKGPAGMVAGSMKNAQVKDCTLSGFLLTESTFVGETAKIVGTEPTGECVFDNNNVSRVIIDEKR